MIYLIPLSLLILALSAMAIYALWRSHVEAQEEAKFQRYLSACSESRQQAPAGSRKRIS